MVQSVPKVLINIQSRFIQNIIRAQKHYSNSLGVYLDVKTCEVNYFLFWFVAIVRLWFMKCFTRILVFKRKYKKKKAFMNCSHGPLIGTRDSSASRVLYHNFSALSSCDLQNDFQSMMSFFSETPRYEEQNLRSAFTFTKDCFYTTIGQIRFLLPHRIEIFLIFWILANEKFCAQKRAQK